MELDQTNEQHFFSQSYTSLRSLTTSPPSSPISFANPHTRHRVVTGLADLRVALEQRFGHDYPSYNAAASPDGEAYIALHDQLQHTLDATLSVSRGLVVTQAEQQAIYSALLACEDALTFFQETRAARNLQLPPALNLPTLTAPQRSPATLPTTSALPTLTPNPPGVSAERPNQATPPVTSAPAGNSITPPVPEPQPPMAIRIVFLAGSFLLALVWLGVERNFEALLGSFTIVGAGAALLAHRRQIRWWVVVVSSSVFVLFGLLYVLSASADANVVVRVVDGSNNPIARASVTLFYEGSTTETLQTDERGSVTFPRTPASSEVKLIAVAEGYQVMEQWVNVSRNQTLEVILERVHTYERLILIRVVSGRSSAPVAGAEVDLIVGASIFSAITDSKGLAQFEVAFPSPTLQVVLTVTVDGTTFTTRNVTLRPNQLHEAHLNIQDEKIEIDTP